MASDSAALTDASTRLSDLSVASKSVGGGDAEDATKKEDYLTEALPGAEASHRLMSEAMGAVQITTSTYQSKIHPNSRDIKVQNLTVILAGKVLLDATDLTLNYGQR